MTFDAAMMRRCGKHVDFVTLEINGIGEDFEEKLRSLSDGLPNVPFLLKSTVLLASIGDQMAQLSIDRKMLNLIK